MEKSAMLEKALDLLMEDMDSIEGKDATSHEMEDCPDPLGCTMHDSDEGEHLTPGDPAIKIEIKKDGLPSMEGEKEGDKAVEGLSPEDAEALKKLLGK